jgi:hypothetical protein
MFEKLTSLFAPSAPSTTFATITVNSALDYENIPMGFFRVVTASGAESRGYRGSFLNFRVGRIVTDGAQCHTCEAPLSELPTVRLAFRKPQNATTTIGGNTVIDTDSLDGDSAVTWNGTEPQSGVSWV